MRLTLLNRFLPPAPGVTGALLYRLAAALAERLPALQLSAIGSDLGYGRHTVAEVAEVPEIEAVRLPSFQSRFGPGLSRGLRLPATLHDGWRMARAAADDHADVVLSCTDPPLLSWWLGRALPHSVRWVEWCMDVYPDAVAAAAGLPPSWLSRLAPRRAPDLRLCLGPGQAAYLAARDHPCHRSRPPVPSVILPAGVLPASSQLSSPRGEGPLTLIYAGNLGRAHAGAALVMLAQALADTLGPTRFRLIIAAHGAGVAALRPQLAGRPGVDWRDDPVDDETLNRADVHVVSLKPAWTHICVPSKAVSALCRGRPLLFFGDGTSDAWGWAAGSRSTGGPGPAAGWRVALDAGGRPDPMGLLMALVALAEPEYLTAATLAAVMAGNRLRTAERSALDTLAGWLRAPVA